METRIIFLMLVIVILWLLINPKSREFIKATTTNIFGSASK